MELIARYAYLNKIDFNLLTPNYINELRIRFKEIILKLAES